MKIDEGRKPFRVLSERTKTGVKWVVGGITLVIFGILCSALFAAIRVEDTEYLMIGFPFFLVVGSVHFLVAKRWAPLVVTFIIGSLVGYCLPFLFG